MLVLSLNTLNSQDPLFTQFFSNALQLNPAMAGRDLSPRLHTTYRNQWPEINKGFVTYNIEYDQFSDKLHGGIGFQLLHDRTGNGSLNTSSFSSIYSYQLAISREWTVNFGIKASFVQKSLNWGDAVWGDQIDPRGIPLGKVKDVVSKMNTRRRNRQEEYYLLGDSNAILQNVLQELDGYYNGLASQSFLGNYIYMNWGQQTFTNGTWTSDIQASSNNLNKSLNNKVYFAGETYNTYGALPVNGSFILRGSVQSAILSGYKVVEEILF